MAHRNLIVITVVGTVDPDAGIREIQAFAQDALSTWGGSRHPDDPMFASINVLKVQAAKISKVEEE